MNNYFSNLKLLSKRIFLLILIYSICRILFLLFQWNSFTNVSALNLIGGIRFDLSAIFYINILSIAAHLIPGKFKYSYIYQRVLQVFFYSSNLLFIASNFIDCVYYDFTGKRSTYHLITAKGMEQEILGLLPSFLAQYWYVLICFIVFSYLFWKVLPKFSYPKNDTTTSSKASILNTTKQTTIFIASIGLCILIGRGGWQRKPLRRVDAINYGKAINSPIVLNTPFCILKTIGKRQELTPYQWFPGEEVQKNYSPIKHYSHQTSFNKKNIVLIILESFGDENVSYSRPDTGNTPFLDSLITQSLYFKNGFANGRVSIDALPSTVSGIPSIVGEPYISSTYAFNTIGSLPKVLKEEGYYTSFFHGAFNGSQNFDQYASIAGFDSYFGKDQYPNPDPSHDDGRWGIFDEEFLQFFGKKLNDFDAPFFSTIFTISSHLPFIMPEKHKKNFKKGPTRFYQTVGYTDYSLKRFFEYAKKQSWYTNTLFVITADHCSSAKKGFYKTKLAEYQIPFLFFDPSNPKLARVSDKNFQQIDILPSILDYLKYPKKFVSYGNSFNETQNLVINFINNVYHVVIDDYYFIFDGKSITELYNYKKDFYLTKNLVGIKITSELEKKVKIYLQSFNKNMINNSLHL